MLLSAEPENVTVAEFQLAFVSLVRAFGLHQPERTPCGQPVATSEAHALLELGSDPSLTQSELAQRLQLKKSTVSRLVAQVEQKGWLERERDTRDRRVQRLRLTDVGRGIAQAITAARTKKFERLVAAIPSEERPGVVETLDLLARVSTYDKEA